jgi:hypothetical protein
MATGFIDFPITEPFVSSHPKIIANEKCAITMNAGSVFPTLGVQDGMCCYRTDLKKLYIRQNNAWVCWTDFTGATTDSSATISVGQLESVLGTLITEGGGKIPS